jgi:hypothetical protein
MNKEKCYLVFSNLSLPSSFENQPFDLYDLHNYISEDADTADPIIDFQKRRIRKEGKKYIIK